MGAGKTGIDAVLFLLENSVDPEHIIWITPNERWLVNRDLIEIDVLPTSILHDAGKLLQSETYEQLIQAWEKAEMIIRIDPTVHAEKMGATVNLEELASLRKVKNVLRQGRVKSIYADRIIFENDHEEKINDHVLYVDCTASCRFSATVPKQLFEGRNITPHHVRLFADTYSVSAVAAFETRFPDDEERKNKALLPFAHPLTMKDFVGSLKQSALNDMSAMQELGHEWLRGNRLNINSHIPADVWQGILENQTKFGAQFMEAIDKIASTL